MNLRGNNSHFSDPFKHFGPSNSLFGQQYAPKWRCLYVCPDFAYLPMPAKVTKTFYDLELLQNLEKYSYRSYASLRCHKSANGASQVQRLM